MPALSRTPAFSRVSQLAEQRSVHQAFQWLHLHQPQIMRWQQEVVSIPAPAFGERTRAEWLIDRFRDLGLTKIEIDAAGNALALYPSSQRSEAASEAAASKSPCILLSAHIDTVFPLTTLIEPVLSDQRLSAPGACDNAAGVVALLAIAAALRHANIEVPCDLLLAGNVGEEGEGDLRGIRHLYQHPGVRFNSHLILDGAGHELVVTAAIGSRRYRVTIEGPGGHSWSDAGRPNPIVALSQVLSRLSALDLSEGTRWNVGVIEGGTSINSIPQSASARFDMRSTDPEQLIRLEVELYRACEDAVLAANAGPMIAVGATIQTAVQPAVTQLRLAIEKIGDRPAGRLPPGSLMFETLRAVDRHLAIRTEERTASTDANIPLSLGREALSIGAGGEGGGTHTSNEWYDARNRELGLRRILLLVLALAEPPASVEGGS